ncbi:hypothetical protein EDD36DRAFT_428092 [Exophiala viscosa]|uniref:EF-hand domain-containing protein n=1 Tax=Exophiala viscosa TaxID=2486360 RepID=A0AAN6IFT5_9EURO|nr:hypothetical protein EDD36DRAFT_428092 [Exophiala viscosa]
MLGTTLAFIFCSAALVASECCPLGQRDGAYCLDGSDPGAFQCCGAGACNIFCCNCDNGCRQPKHVAARGLKGWSAWTGEPPTCGLAQNENQCLLDKFEAVDTNHDGKITIAELLAGIDILRPLLAEYDLDAATTKKDAITLFNAYDVDKDGHLTFVEASTPQDVKF